MRTLTLGRNPIQNILHLFLTYLKYPAFLLKIFLDYNNDIRGIQEIIYIWETNKHARIKDFYFINERERESLFTYLSSFKVQQMEIIANDQKVV